MELQEVILSIRVQNGAVLRWNGLSGKVYDFVREDRRNMHVRVYTEKPTLGHHVPLERFQSEMVDIFSSPNIQIWGGIFTELVSVAEAAKREAEKKLAAEVRAKQQKEHAELHERLRLEREEAERKALEFANDPSDFLDTESEEQAEQSNQADPSPKPKRRRAPRKQVLVPGVEAHEATVRRVSSSAPGIEALEQKLAGSLVTV
jgi:hypothetical protein